MTCAWLPSQHCPNNGTHSLQWREELPRHECYQSLLAMRRSYISEAFHVRNVIPMAIGIFYSICLWGANGKLRKEYGSMKELREFLLHWKKKWSHFDQKSWVTGRTKIWPGIPSNWRIFESNWLDIESQLDSNILQLLGIPGRILVLPVTRLFRSKWHHFVFQCFLPLCPVRAEG